MPHILFYVTSHGLGHATRALSIISKLLQEERGQNDFSGCKNRSESQQESSYLSSTSMSITLVTGKGTRIPHSLLPVASGSNTLAFRESALIDPGVLQSSPTTINTEGTWDLQQEFIASLPDRIQEEVSYLTSPSIDKVFDASSSKSKTSRKRFDLAIMDATPFPAIACHKANIPTLLITNFTFDAIFSHFATSPAHWDIVKTYTEAYNFIPTLFRLPGHIPIPSFTNVPLIDHKSLRQHQQLPHLSLHRTVIQVPLLHRPLQESRSQILQALNIPPQSQILFICFGSWTPTFSSPSSTTLSFQSLVPDPTSWHIISLSPLPIASHPNLHILPSSSHTPSLISASSVVLGKLGYGLCSETVGLNTPLLYIPRPQFLEEQGLIKLMDSQSLGLEMDKSDFDAGNWVPYLERILEKRPHPMLKPQQEIGEESQGTKVVSNLISAVLGSRRVGGDDGLPCLPVYAIEDSSKTHYVVEMESTLISATLTE